jgi:hypothetical protein
MNLELNYTLIFLATLAQFVLGALWYSPLMFGKWWMQIMEMTKLSKDEMQKMQKEMAPYYGMQMVITFMSTWVYAMLLSQLPQFHAYGLAGWIWIGFIVPTQIASVVWANTKRKYWAKQIFVMISYQFVGAMMMAWIMSM